MGTLVRNELESGRRCITNPPVFCCSEVPIKRQRFKGLMKDFDDMAFPVTFICREELLSEFCGG